METTIYNFSGHTGLYQFHNLQCHNIMVLFSGHSADTGPFLNYGQGRDRGGEGAGRAAAPPLFCALAPTFCSKKKNN